MAVYKVVDAEQLDGAMLETAKAIRAKGGTEAPITWNKSIGYKEAVEAITGGGLNFTVIGGTKPTNPTENTVWVDTTTQPNKWTVSPDRPATANAGDIWVQTTNAGELIDVLDENSLVIGVGGAEQYNGSAWVMIPAEVYTNNTWKELTSDYPVFVRGGSSNVEFSTWTSHSVTVVNDGSSLQCITNTNVNSDYTIYTSAPIDVSDYDVLEVVVEFGDYIVGRNYSHVGLTGSIKSETKEQAYAVSAGFSDAANGEKRQYNIDIGSADLSGEYYVTLSGFAIAFTVASITLKRSA